MDIVDRYVLCIIYTYNHIYIYYILQYIQHSKRERRITMHGNAWGCCRPNGAFSKHGRLCSTTGASLCRFRAFVQSSLSVLLPRASKLCFTKLWQWLWPCDVHSWEKRYEGKRVIICIAHSGGNTILHSLCDLLETCRQEGHSEGTVKIPSHVNRSISEGTDRYSVTVSRLASPCHTMSHLHFSQLLHELIQVLRTSQRWMTYP